MWWAEHLQEHFKHDDDPQEALNKLPSSAYDCIAAATPRCWYARCSSTREEEKETAASEHSQILSAQ
jgi:hypothetical protein